MDKSEQHIKKKIESLDKRIEEAQAGYEEDYCPPDPSEKESPGAKKSAHAGSEFLASVFAGAFIGYGIDWYFNTTPWAMIVFIIMGFVSGVFRANAAMKNTDKNT